MKIEEAINHNMSSTREAISSLASLHVGTKKFTPNSSNQGYTSHSCVYYEGSHHHKDCTKVTDKQHRLMVERRTGCVSILSTNIRVYVIVVQRVGARCAIKSITHHYVAVVTNVIRRNHIIIQSKIYRIPLMLR